MSLMIGATAAMGQVDAVTAPRYDLKLGFTEGGKVLGTPVKPGTKVKKGDLLIELDDREGATLVALYKISNDSQVSVLAATAKYELAVLEESNLKRIWEADAGSHYEYQKAQSSLKVAQYEKEYAEQQHKEDELKYAQAQARHDKFTLHAPFDGIVEVVLVSEGELVEPLKPVMRMVVIDPLWVDAAVPTHLTLKIKVGDPAWAQINLKDHTVVIKGTVIFVAQVADGASDTRVVRVEIPNTEPLPAGGHVTVYFTPLPEQSAAKTEGK